MTDVSVSRLTRGEPLRRPRTLRECVAMAGGLVHRRLLAASGFDSRALVQAAERGTVLRVRRDWFALPGCDGRLLAAVQVGGRLSCVSLAELHGLWVVHDDRLHLAVHRSTPRIMRRPDVRLHWSRRPLVGGFRAADTLEEALIRVADCQPYDAAVAVFDSALNSGSATLGQLRELAGRHEATRRVVAGCDGRADSGLESIVRVRLAHLGIVMEPQVVLDGRPVDGLIGGRVVIQCDGYGPHSHRAQRNRDLEQDVRLRRLGYTVLRFSYDQIMDDWEWVLDAILAAIAHV